jgi:hypothetical protein
MDKSPYGQESVWRSLSATGLARSALHCGQPGESLVARGTDLIVSDGKAGYTCRSCFYWQVGMHYTGSLPPFIWRPICVK